MNLDVNYYSSSLIDYLPISEHFSPEVKKIIAKATEDEKINQRLRVVLPEFKKIVGIPDDCIIITAFHPLEYRKAVLHLMETVIENQENKQLIENLKKESKKFRKIKPSRYIYTNGDGLIKLSE